MKAFNSTLNLVSKRREASGQPIGLKTRRGLKAKHGLKAKSHLKPVSKRRFTEGSKYCVVRAKLIGLAHHASELTGKYGDLEPHHINGRVGKLLSEPFNIILLLRTEHEYYTNGEGCTRKAKEFLAAFIRPIRIKQGFTENKS